MDPYVATRQQFTDHLVNKRLPSNATEDWKITALDLQSLLRKLADHEAMRANLQQTYMTPANEKNRVYFMWDFVGRTLGMLYQVPADISFQNMGEAQKEAYGEILGRNVMAGGLILDDKPGMLNSLMEQYYPGQAGRHPEFGESILEDARRLFGRGR